MVYGENAQEFKVMGDFKLNEDGTIPEGVKVSDNEGGIWVYAEDGFRKETYSKDDIIIIGEGEEAQECTVMEGFSLDALNIDKLIDTLPKRIELVRTHASITQRMQVVHDLAVVARAEGKITDNELVVLYQIADGLGIPRSLISQLLHREAGLD